MNEPQSCNNIKKKSAYFILLVMLCMICVISLFSSDIYLPAMPDIARTLNAKATQIQLTLTVYLIGLAICQLFYGPLSDKYGRKKLLIAGITIFIIASLECSFAKTLTQLIIARFFQAIGAASGMVMSRAITGDLFDRKEASKVFTTIFPVVGASSAIAPIIGGYLTDWAGWQSCFTVLSLYGVILLLMISHFLSETRKINNTHLKNERKITEMVNILKNSSFIGFTLIVSCAYAAYFGYIATTPFLFKKYGFTAHQIGYFYILLSFFYIVTNLTGKKLINYYSINNLVFAGIVLFLIGSISMVGAAVTGINSPYGLIIPMSILTAANGFLFPLGTASTVTLFPNSAGTASGLMGFLQLSAASISTGVIGYLTHNKELPVALVITAIAIMCSLSFYFFISRGFYANETI